MKKLLTFLFVLFATHAEATTYYVSQGAGGTPMGDNARSCATASVVTTPKLTLNNAVGCLSPGDTLLVRQGTYVESLFGVIPAGTSWLSRVRIANYPDGCSPNAPNSCGTAGELVWLIPAAGDFRVLDFSGSQQYIEVDGINLDGANVMYDSVKINEGGGVSSNAHHIRLQNLELKGPNHSGFGAPTGQGILDAAGDTTSQGHNELINLKMHAGLANDFDHMFYIQSAGNLIERCEVYDFPGGGIQLYNGNGLGATPDDNIVRKNVFRNGRSTMSGQRHPGIVDTGARNLIYDNIVRDMANDSYITIGISIYAGSTNAGVYNNTVVNSVQGILIDSGASSPTLRNNISYGNGGNTTAENYSSTGSGVTQDHNAFNGTAPGFTNYATRDLTLTVGGAAVDAGTSVGSVTDDLIGTPRPQNGIYDEGAYELIPAAPPATNGSISKRLRNRM